MRASFPRSGERGYGKDAYLVQASSSPRRAVAVAEFRDLGRKLAIAGAVLSLAVALVFSARRVLDSWQRALTGGELLLMTGVLVGSAFAYHRLYPPQRRRSAGWRWQLAASLVPTLAAILLAAATSSAESPLWAVILLWAALTCEETWFWVSLYRPSPPVDRAPVQRRVEVARSSDSRSSAMPDRESLAEAGDDESSLADEPSPELSLPDSFPADRLQQITRSRDEDGGEVIHALVRAELAAGQRVEHFHLAFCPPLPAAPEVHFEQVDGPEASLLLAQSESYGARIDLRLAAPARSGECVVVELYAKCNG